MSRRVGRFVSVALVSALAASSSHADTEAPKVTADSVRARGFPCLEPSSAQRDPAASQADEAVWILECQDARYRVRFKGDAPPEIERL